MFGDIEFDGKIKANCRLRVRLCLHIAIGDSEEASRGVPVRIAFLFQRCDARCAEFGLFRRGDGSCSRA
jgi:hypothetical protein